MTKKWSIKREFSRNFDIEGNFTGYNHHRVWVLRYGRTRVATYRHWRMCIEHIDKCVEKFGDRYA